MALVNAIKKRLTEAAVILPQPTTIAPPQKDVEMIDTSSKQEQQQKVITTQKSMEEVKQNETVDIGLAILIELKESDLAGNEPQHRDTVQTLYKIIANLISKPLDP